jgi:phospholipid transport system substrate-binding protein
MMSPLVSRRLVLCLAVAAAVVSAPAGATNGAPAQLIDKVAGEVIALVKSTSGPQREAGIRNVLLANFDMAAMGRAALAKHWDSMNATQRDRYLKAVISAEARAYSERFGQYGGQTLAVGKVTSRPNGVSVVDSKLNQTNGQPIVIQWEVRDTGQGLRITDVKIEGVSMVMTRRSDFNSYIQGKAGQVEALIEELEKRAGK